MADMLPSPPATREASPQDLHEHGSKDESIRRLDALLEEYLEALDEYTLLREQLSKTFSNGFFALAQAQRNSNMGPGRRYGQDGYDSRVRALRRVNITKAVEQVEAAKFSASSREPDEFSVYSYTPETDEPAHVEGMSPQQENDGSHVSLSKHNKDSVRESVVQESDTAHKRAKIDPAYRDPVTWYGILVPPALRQSQTHFLKSVETEVPKLLSTVSTLRSLGLQISATRADLGMQDRVSAEPSEVPCRPK